MSLPAVDSQPTLFGSIAAVAGDLFAEDDRYRLFARKIWPVLAGTRAELEKCYCSDNGRPGIEPVVLLGVLIFQFLERLPDRQALEMVKYHLGWKLALNLELEEKAFHPTVLVYFRQRLLAHGQSLVAFGPIVEALQQEGLIAKKTRQRLDSTHVIGVVARLSILECTRETLRLALEELFKKQWVGYKVQVAESIGPREEEKEEQAQAPRKNFLTSIVTQSAIESDDAGLPATLAKQKEMGLEAPSEI